ncbi:MAG: hypothetical protein AMXMBFR56_07010 [Polyangiaceae bacterium]
MTALGASFRWLAISVLLAAALGLSCSSDDGGVAGGTGAVTGTGATSGSGGAGGGSGGIGIGGAGGAQGPFPDFPKEPEIEASLPSDIGSQFGAPGQPSGGPCLSEPPVDALVPKNWTPLRFEWSAPAEQNVFELRLHVDNQVNDLVVYTTQKSYTISASVWKALTLHSAGHDVEVTVRGAKLDSGKLTAGPFTGVQGPVHIAPVAAPGSVVYWTSGAPGSGQTALKGFSIGDTSVTTVLTPSIVGGDTTCVACHVSAPDGKHTFYTRDGVNTRSVDVRSVDGLGSAPAAVAVSPTALSLLGRTKQSAPATSKARYSATDAVAVTVFHDATATAGKYELIWTDLHTSDPTTGWGTFARTGDTRQVASPTWWHDGSTIAYVSAPITGEGVIARITDADPTMDIYTIPYNERKGGPATPLAGASDPAFWEYYPVISPGDALLAFNRCAPRKESDGTWADSYNEPTGEVFVVPGKGGTAVRLAANDPPACTQKTSPGLTNSWPRWAPTAEEFGGKKYYWIVFSSTRRDASNPQLFVAGVVTSESGGQVSIDKTYPAIYVTAQVVEENNHTPAWDVFQVKPPQ